jgi:SpoVK/Ycf46/Vps4 family AAA+-type ATPase
MSQVFRKARAEAPCVLILEDLDSLINDSNRSFFLNQLDGLENNDGLLVIGSTNHYDRLDPAITKRPSRFDRKLFVPFRRSTRLDANLTEAYLTNPPTMNEYYTFNIGRRNLDTTRTFRSQTLSRIRLQTSHTISASRI